MVNAAPCFGYLRCAGNEIGQLAGRIFAFFTRLVVEELGRGVWVVPEVRERKSLVRCERARDHAITIVFQRISAPEAVRNRVRRDDLRLRAAPSWSADRA